MERNLWKEKSLIAELLVGGLVRIAIAAVAIIIAVIVLVTAARSQDPDDNLGNIFMYIVGGIMVVILLQAE